MKDAILATKKLDDLRQKSAIKEATSVSTIIEEGLHKIECWLGLTSAQLNEDSKYRILGTGPAIGYFNRTLCSGTR